MNFNKLSPVVAAAIALFLGTAQAATITLNSVDNGWYTQNGDHHTDNTNTWTGTDGYGTYRSSFYNFVVPTMAFGETVIAATLSFIGGNGNYMSRDAHETVQIWNVSTDAGAGPSAQVYQDLMSGVLYGSVDVVGKSGDAMPAFDVVLGAQALSDIVRGNDFRVGAAISTLAAGAEQVLWWSSGLSPAALLTIETGAAPLAAPSAVSLPGTAPLAVLALSAAALIRRRRVA